MANNRMMLVCNTCYPTDEDIYANHGKSWAEQRPDFISVGKWYPVGSYRTHTDLELGNAINEYLDRHSHELDDPKLNENPVRLTYETWVIDQPAITAWKYEPNASD
jgi:hypothetical protein